MRIDRQLNLVVPIKIEEGVVYVYASPLDKAVFEHYFLVMSKTFAAIYAEGLNVIAGPRIAVLMLKEIAENMGRWSDSGDKIGVERGLMGEIRRTASVLLPTSDGWKNVPLQEAITHNYLDQDDIDEAEGFILFFILASAIHKRSQLSSFLDSLCGLWSTQTTSLTFTAFRNSLQISSEDESTGADAQNPEPIAVDPEVAKPLQIAY